MTTRPPFRPLSRRTLLKASGVSLALPLLESMAPAVGAAARAAENAGPPDRLVFVCTALGLHPPDFWPDGAGEDYEASPYLSLLGERRDDFTVFGGLRHEDQTGRQPHDSEMTWLTAARHPGTGGFRNTVSVDQVAAAAVGNATRLPSVTLGTLKAQSQSYTPGGVMIPARTSPAGLFAELFLDGDPAAALKKRRALADGRSILDELGDGRGRLRPAASAADNHLLDDYFDAVREAERGIAERQGWLDEPKPAVDAGPARDVPDPADLLGRTRALLDLVPLMLQTDSTRVVSVMIQDHYAVPKVEGVTGNHHNLSHHGRDPQKIAQLRRIESGLVESFGDLLAGLRSRPEAGGTLLSRTQALFGSNLGNANAHDATNLPVVLAGGGHAHGRFVRYDEKPLCDLFVAMLNHAGVETEAFGQSAGALTW